MTIKKVELFCPVVKGNCIKSECLAFTTERPLPEHERRALLAADIPIWDGLRKEDYCLHLKTALIPCYEMVEEQTE